MPKKLNLVSNVTVETGTSLPAMSFDGSNYIAAGSTKTLTEADHMSTVKLDTVTGSVVTLPAATGTGKRFRFVVSVLATSPNHVVKVGTATDVMQGNITLGGTAALPASSSSVFAPAATHDTITLNRTTSGGVTIGEWFELQDFAAGVWQVRGVLTATGTPATPFSNTV